MLHTNLPAQQKMSGGHLTHAQRGARALCGASRRAQLCVARTARIFRKSTTPGMQGGGCNTETHLTVFAGRHPARVSLRSPVSPCGPRVGLCRARLRCAPSHDTPHFFDKPSSEQDTETSASSLRRVYSRGLAVLWERQQQRQTTPVR